MLTRYWRHILFFVFAAGFFISAPLVVLFTAGYRYHFESGKIVQTGVINVHSVPKGADVLIDGSVQREKTPAVIDNIIPGSHEVIIRKDGYTSWKKTLEVSSRQGIFVSQAILFLTQNPERVEMNDATKKPIDATKWTANTQQYRIQNAQDRSVLSRIDEQNLASIIAYLPLSTYELELAPAPYVLLRDTIRERIVLVNAEEKTQPILLNTDANQWAWSPSGDALLFSDGFDIEVYAPSLHIRETITRLSQPIFGLTWYPLGRVAIFGSGGDIFAQELDRRGEPNKTTLIEGLLIKEFWFLDEGTWIIGVTESGELFRKRLQR